MNTYNIDLSGGQNSLNADYIPEVLKAIGYMHLFGENITYQRNSYGFGGLTPPVYGPMISFDLNFSLSNLSILDVPQPTGPATSNTLILTTEKYDTKSQSVKEWVDKPFAKKGDLVIAFDDLTGNTPDKDYDNFYRIPCQYFKIVSQLAYIYIGISSQDLTNFYNPFANLPIAIANLK